MTLYSPHYICTYVGKISLDKLSSGIDKLNSRLIRAKQVQFRTTKVQRRANRFKYVMFKANKSR